MKARTATLEELIAEGILTPEEAQSIDDAARYIEETGELPPAKKVTVREVGRPKKLGEELEHISVRVTKTQRSFLDDYAHEAGISFTDAMREAIDFFHDAKEQLAHT